MSKIHVRKDDKGVWRDREGKCLKQLTGVVYHYGRSLPAPTRRTTSTVSSSRPNISKNVGIHADQVEQFNKDCGPGIEYEAGTGYMKSNSWAAREREARRREMSFG